MNVILDPTPAAFVAPPVPTAPLGVDDDDPYRWVGYESAYPQPALSAAAPGAVMLQWPSVAPGRWRMAVDAG